MTKEDIEWLIIELIAADNGLEAAALYRELAEAGGQLPVNSLLAAEVLAQVESLVGVELPTTPETARALRSVKAFAAAAWELLPKPQTEAASA